MFSALETVFDTSGTRQFGKWWEFSNLSDVSFNVYFDDGQKVEYKLHRDILVLSGQFFEELLYSSDGKKTSDSFTFAYSNRKVYEICLKFVYRILDYKTLLELNNHELDELKFMSQTFTLEDLSRICNCIFYSKITKDNVFECLYVAMKTENETYLEGCLKFIAGEARDLFKDERFYQLKPEMVLEIMKITHWDIYEIEVLETIIKYAEKVVDKYVPRCASMKDIVGRDLIKRFCNSQLVEIEMIYDATDSSNHGLVLYRNCVTSAQTRKRIRYFLLQTKLLSTARVLTIDIRHFMFQTTPWTVFNGNELLYICNQLKYQNNNSRDTQVDNSGPFICLNPELRGGFTESTKTDKRKTIVYGCVKFLTDGMIHTEYTERMNEEFVYDYDIPASITWMVFKGMVSKPGNYKAELFVNNLTICNQFVFKPCGDDKVSVMFVYRRKYLLKRGDRVRISIGVREGVNLSLRKFCFHLRQKCDGREILTCQNKYMTCVHKIMFGFEI